MAVYGFTDTVDGMPLVVVNGLLRANNRSCLERRFEPYSHFAPEPRFAVITVCSRDRVPNCGGWRLKLGHNCGNFSSEGQVPAVRNDRSGVPQGNSKCDN